MRAAPLCLLFVLALAATACGDPARRAITVDGIERYYLLHVPEGLEGEAPLVVALHGGTGSAEDMRKVSKFEQLGETEGFITVYPNARYENWNDGRLGEELKESAEGVDDHAYLAAVMDAVGEEVAVDYDRVYVTGPSNGGIMTYSLACSPIGDRFAAIAPVIASIAVGVAPECAPVRPLPMLAMNGSDDQFIRLEGGDVYKGGRGAVIPVEDAVQTMVMANGCQGEPATSTQDDVDDGTSLSVRTWSDCTAGAEVEHTGARRVIDAITGTTSQELSATERIWSFVSRFERVPLPSE